MNAAVMNRLWNATATRERDAKSFPVIYDRATVESFAGVTGTQPMATAADGDAAGTLPHQDVLTINAVRHVVRDLRPDGTGLTEIILELEDA